VGTAKTDKWSRAITMSDNRSSSQIGTLRQLQERVQGQVRQANDIGGVLWGDWLSPPITKLFLALGLSPTIATIGMLPVGVVGSVLVAFGGVYAIAGAVFLILFYVLDCVDGEVARFRNEVKYFWSYADYFFGIWVMSLFYIALGISVAVYTGIPWFGLLGALCTIMFLTKKIVDVAHIFLLLQQVFLAPMHQRADFLREIGVDPAAAPVNVAAHGERRDGRVIGRSDIIVRYGTVLGLLRGIVMNFHISMVFFFAVSVFDVMTSGFAVFGVDFNGKGVFLLTYTALIAFNTLDHFVYGWRIGFMSKSKVLAERLLGH